MHFFFKMFILIFLIFSCRCRLCINFQDLCASLLGDNFGDISLRILLLTFISRFVIDFLSI